MSMLNDSPVSTYTAMKSGLKVHLQLDLSLYRDEKPLLALLRVSTYTAMKSGLKVRSSQLRLNYTAMKSGQSCYCLNLYRDEKRSRTG